VRIDVDHSIFGKRPTKLEILESRPTPRSPSRSTAATETRPEDCNACYVASDFAYDAARGS
jgi:hypothetical protein